MIKCLAPINGQGLVPLPFEGDGDTRGPTGDMIGRASLHLKQKQLDLHLAVAWWNAASQQTRRLRLAAFEL